jgi:L-lactate dehydrogenase complex protein LldG
MSIDLFTRQAEAVGAEVRLVAGRQAAIDAVVAVLRQEGVEDAPGRWAVWAAQDLPVEARAGVLNSVPGVKFEVTTENASQALAGVSEVEWGIAQTGTLLSDSSAVDRRLVSTLPPLHIALLPAPQVVEDLGSALARVDARRSAFLAAITGPSRTADIERVLTIGVHGPRRLLILLIQPTDGGARA